jgi:predicted ABC-type transport system involved in lysophospholipase L1 biosynthesis ATPase subunit
VTTAAVASKRLEARDVTMAFAGLVALKDVTFSVSKGEIVGLIGPNGSGKTTLLNVISGALRPTSGEFSLAARTWGSITPERAARLGIRRTFQNLRLFGDMTALETAEVPAAALGRGDRRGHALEALGDVGLSGHATGVPAPRRARRGPEQRRVGGASEDDPRAAGPARLRGRADRARPAPDHGRVRPDRRAQPRGRDRIWNAGSGSERPRSSPRLPRLAAAPDGARPAAPKQRDDSGVRIAYDAVGYNGM